MSKRNGKPTARTEEIVPLGNFSGNSLKVTVQNPASGNPTESNFEYRNKY